MQTRDYTKREVGGFRFRSNLIVKLFNIGLYKDVYSDYDMYDTKRELSYPTGTKYVICKTKGIK